MRKIKTLTLLVLMLGSIVTTQAQEKQNDATWEETIEFLRDNISKFNIIQTYKKSYKDTPSKIENKYTIERDLIIANSGDWLFKADLRELKAVLIAKRLGSSDKQPVYHFQLEFTKNSVSSRYNDGEEPKGKHIIISLCEYIYITKEDSSCSDPLWKIDDEFVQRMLKAFKHLAYLANEKRKESKF